jgi:hypothetical protein
MLELRFVLAGLLATAGCAVWFWEGTGLLFSISLAIATLLSLSLGSLARPVRFRPIDARGGLVGAIVILGLVVVGLLLVVLVPDALLRKWYSVAILWLLFVSLLLARYRQEKRKQKAPPVVAAAPQ